MSEQETTPHLPPSEIEGALADIWRSFHGTNKMRACLFNLIIYTQRGERSNYLGCVAQKVIQKFPSRIIFITYDSACTTRDVQAKVSVLTAKSGDNAIACDLIELAVCGHNHPRVPFVVLPHILPDLPIFLLYTEDPLEENSVAIQLQDLAHRIIFDSEATHDLPAYATHILNMHRTYHGDIADLNWARIEGWRHLFANVFRKKEEIHHLKKATEVHIHYNEKPTSYLRHTNIQALYLQGWLASQMGWNLAEIHPSASSISFLYANNGPTVTLYPSVREDLSSGRITSISIISSGNTYKMKREKSNSITIEKSTPTSCMIPTYYLLEKEISGQSLVREICHRGTSSHYLEMMSLFAPIRSEHLI